MMFVLQMFVYYISKHIRFNLASSPKVRPTIHQIKDLSRIEQLLEAAQEFHTLVVTTFGVDKDQEGTGT